MDFNWSSSIRWCLFVRWLVLSYLVNKNIVIKCDSEIHNITLNRKLSCCYHVEIHVDDYGGHGHHGGEETLGHLEVLLVVLR